MLRPGKPAGANGLTVGAARACRGELVPDGAGRGSKTSRTCRMVPSSSVPEAASGALPAAGTAILGGNRRALAMPKPALPGYRPLPTPGPASWNPAKTRVPLEAGGSLAAPAG